MTIDVVRHRALRVLCGDEEPEVHACWPRGSAYPR
jgi:hypothetical protein